MKNSATDSLKFLSSMIGQSLDSWKHRAEPMKTCAEAPAMNIVRGQYVFATKCAACHTIGYGDGIEPDLAGVTSQA